MNLTMPENTRAYYLEPFRLTNGLFRRWQHGIVCGIPMGTVHGDQYLPPSVMHPPGVYCTDDFGDSHVVLDQAARNQMLWAWQA